MNSLFDLVRLASAEVYMELIANEVGGDPSRPETVVKAAQRLRDEVARLKGYPSTPHEERVPYEERGW